MYLAFPESIATAHNASQGQFTVLFLQKTKYYQHWSIILRSDFYRFACLTPAGASLLLATHITCTNIRNVQSCCERLVSADVDWCTWMKSECTIILKIHVNYESTMITGVGPLLCTKDSWCTKYHEYRETKKLKKCIVVRLRHLWGKQSPNISKWFFFLFLAKEQSFLNLNLWNYGWEEHFLSHRKGKRHGKRTPWLNWGLLLGNNLLVIAQIDTFPRPQVHTWPTCQTWVCVCVCMSIFFFTERFYDL